MKFCDASSTSILAALLVALAQWASAAKHEMTLVRYWDGDCPAGGFCTWNDCPYFLTNQTGGYNCAPDHATCPEPVDSAKNHPTTFLSLDKLDKRDCKSWDDGNLSGHAIFHIPSWFQGQDYRHDFTICKVTYFAEKDCKGAGLYTYTQWDNRMCRPIKGAWSVKTECSNDPNHKTGGETDTGVAEGEDGIDDGGK